MYQNQLGIWLRWRGNIWAMGSVSGLEKHQLPGPKRSTQLRDHRASCGVCCLELSGLMKLESATYGQGLLVSRQVCRPSGGSLKVALSEGYGMNWLTFESLFLSEDSLSLGLDFCSVTMQCGLSLLCIYLCIFSQFFRQTKL